jgi:acetyl esterase/lipase
MPFQLDPEVATALEALMGSATRPPPAPIGDVKARRDMCDLMALAFQASLPSHDDISQTDFHIKTPDGHELLLRWYTEIGTTLKNSPAVLYIHGGGMIAMCVGHYDKAMQNYVHQTGVPFLSVEYRLAPEFPAPIPVEDSYTALEWLHSNASKFGVDSNRIAIMGDSGGGGIAASLAHFALKKKGPKIAKQILIYPMLDD